MPGYVAFWGCLAFIAWLFFRDRKLRPMTSGALWPALSWVLILGSRPISAWFHPQTSLESPEQYLEGSAFDRNVFLALILLTFVLLRRRGVEWRELLRANRWFAAYFGFCLLSIVWSDFPFVALKRWIKDAGNVLVVLILVTEKSPVQAVRAVFLRYAYVAVPLSVVFIKYFPDIGRYYNVWTWEASFCGISYEKNALGQITWICIVFLLWDLLQARRDDLPAKVDFGARAAVAALGFWLITRAESATALVAAFFGVALLLGMRTSFARRNVRQIGRGAVALLGLAAVVYMTPGLFKMVVGVVGRDMTLTGRTALWADLLKQPFNPILGTGYQSFWLGSRAEAMWELYYFHPNQAHNGFLETYINLGFVGLVLLLGLLVTSFRNLASGLRAGEDYAVLRVALISTALLSNWTEATFNNLNLVWIVILVASLQKPKTAAAPDDRSLQGKRAVPTTAVKAKA